MENEKLIKYLKEKKDLYSFSELINEQPDLIIDLINIMFNDQTTIKFRAEKVIRLISEKNPKLLYPYFERLSNLLDSSNSFLKWGGIFILSNLNTVDYENKFDKIFDKYFSLIKSNEMITVGNVIKCSKFIAQSKPYLADRIVEAILYVEKSKFIIKGKISEECSNIIKGQAIDSFDVIIDIVKDKIKIFEFVSKQLNNQRNSTRKKAEKFLTKRGEKNYKNNLFAK